MEHQKQKDPLDPNIIRRKVFLVQKFIHFLIVIRMYLTQIPIWIWATVLVLLYALKLRREGNIPSSILVIIAMLCSVCGQYFKNDVVYLIAPILAGISHFFSYKIYWFPKLNHPVGMRQEILENDIYLMEFYPIKKNQNTRKKVINWNHRLQMKRILQHQGNNGPIYRALLLFLTSAWTKIKLIFAEGDEQPCNKAIVFSHGRCSTPLMYSQLLMRMVSLQTQNFDIFAVQHNEKNSTGETEHHKIKKYREIEVQVRAAQMYSAVQHCKDKKQVVLMGHSYGGATTVQTYHCLPAELQKKVSHMILLDPWLFSLTDAKLAHQIDCPILVLANEYFLENEDVYNRNKQFYQSHKKGRIIYLSWKQGDHLHQIDLCFMMGNILNKVKHPELSIQMLNKNLKAIQMFLGEKNVTEEKMRENFKDDLLPVDYKPLKWNNYLSL